MNEISMREKIISIRLNGNILPFEVIESLKNIGITTINDFINMTSAIEKAGIKISIKGTRIKEEKPKIDTPISSIGLPKKMEELILKKCKTVEEFLQLEDPFKALAHYDTSRFDDYSGNISQVFTELAKRGFLPKYEMLFRISLYEIDVIGNHNEKLRKAGFHNFGEVLMAHNVLIEIRGMGRASINRLSSFFSKYDINLLKFKI